MSQQKGIHSKIITLALYNGELRNYIVSLQKQKQGKTVKAGSLLGSNNREGEMIDTSPNLGAPPSTSTEMPDPAKQPPPRHSALGQAVTPSKTWHSSPVLDNISKIGLFVSHLKALINLFLKVRYTLGNYHILMIHDITNLWNLVIKWSSNLQVNNKKTKEQKTPVLYNIVCPEINWFEFSFPFSVR